MSSFQNTIESPALEPEQKQLVEATLQVLLHSSVFSTAHRSRRFLSYVVEHYMMGNAQSFKERTIGVEVFDRPLDYSTGEDPVVRVLAGDLRRRLERFYHLPEAKDLPVVITLPVGSYCPALHFREPVATTAVAEVEPPRLVLPTEPSPPPSKEVVVEASTAVPRRWIAAVAVSLLAAILAWAAFEMLRPHRAPETEADKFWQPFFSSHQPIVIGLAKTITYHPTQKLFDEYVATHPGEFAAEYQRLTEPLPLSDSAKISWSDMTQLSDYGVAAGDVYASSQLSILFAQKDKSSQLRIGQDYSFEDLRKFPAVLVGAFNNRWTMQVTSGMPVSFDEDKFHRLSILERDGEHRAWWPQPGKQDVGLVARVRSAETGQFVVVVGGIGANGTQAATEFVCSSEYLAAALKQLNSGWQNRNIAIVLKTTVTEGVAGPPVVVATKIW